MLFRQGEAADRVFVLLDGRVKVAQSTREGGEMVVRFIGPGELFGCVPLIGQDRYPGTAEALEPGTVLAWDGATMGDFVKRYPTLASNALRVVGSRMREFMARLQEVSTERVEQRVARAILRLAQQAGRRTDEGIRIDFPISRAELADMTATTLYSVSRILAEWERRGVVATERRRIVIRQPHALVSIAEAL